MPRGDRTGPRGMGPMTGRRAGYCADYPVPGYANAGPGVGPGTGFGYGGRGWRNRFYATGQPGWARYDAPWGVPPYAPSVTREQEMDWLKSHVGALQSEIEGANKRISELEEK